MHNDGDVDAVARTRNLPPRAGPMLEALRGIGYSTAAAVADIIDNGIAAGASTIHVRFTWAGVNSWILIVDDGWGMSDSDLERAMCLGERSPLTTRTPNDLGRFGLGLKTASFSQCRRLTVASINAGASSCLRWDLDEIAAHPDRGWMLFEGPAPGSEPLVEPEVGTDHGTSVLWEVLDRIVTDGYSVNDFLDLIDVVEGHCAMVFHRLLDGTRPRLRLLINEKAVRPWDPFMSGHPAKPWASPVERVHTAIGTVEIQCHVLPHKDRITTDEYASGAGPEGWTAQQGFYVYRNERLLLAGGWLGLGPRAWIREEAHRLARIRLDIPNTADDAWKIDIRKSTARPPVSLRPWLTRLADDTRERARKVFAFRGSPSPGPSGIAVEAAWRTEQTSAGARYRIEEKHPAVAAVLDVMQGRTDLVRAMLRVVEETVPIQRIWLDTAQDKETPRTGFSGEPPAAVAEVMRTLYADMTGRRRMDSGAAKDLLLASEPFQNYPELVASLPEPSAPARPETPSGEK